VISVVRGLRPSGLSSTRIDGASPTCICLAVRILEHALRTASLSSIIASEAPASLLPPLGLANALLHAIMHLRFPPSLQHSPLPPLASPLLSLLLFRLRHSSCPLHPKIPRPCPTGSPSASGGSQSSSSVRSVMGSLRNSCRRHPVWAR
jgi:hypothetical protein